MQQPNAFAQRETIKARVIDLGFCLCGVTDMAPLAGYDRYTGWLAAGHHGEMSYLASERHLQMRKDPALLFPWAKSIVVLAWPYPLNRASASAPAGQIAGYVGRQDYHLFLPQKISRLAEGLPALLGRPVQSAVCCDSSPLLERELAVRAGLGWIGRNSCLISPKFGSALLLAELFLDVDLPADEPFAKDLCGTCQRCLNECPTACILPERTLDARRCISNLTIENKGTMPPALARQVGNHLFGCDICQAVCPWNRRAPAQEKALAEMDENEMIAALQLSQEQFSQGYRGTAFLRSKRRGWVRNLCTVLANLKSDAARAALRRLAEKDTDPVCRASAAVALAEIDTPGTIPGLD